MSIPEFHYSQAKAADRATARVFADLCVSTGRFARNEKGAVVWSPAPDDWIPIARAAEFRTVLEDGDVLKITGDLNGDAFFTLWTYLNDQRWKLPRLNPQTPYSPPAPLPVRNVGQVRR